jgi:hypothetical protein
VTTVEEGIEVLTHVPAGVRDDKGRFPADSVYGKVQKKLMYFLNQSLKLKSLSGAMGSKSED